ncbi:hypothetical protein J6590_038528 [Homalodisca vitripennis]|nr:hypothetical protein J6590_038528 [Homalodisca vitripennis]
MTGREGGVVGGTVQTGCPAAGSLDSGDRIRINQDPVVADTTVPITVTELDTLTSEWTGQWRERDTSSPRTLIWSIYWNVLRAVPATCSGGAVAGCPCRERCRRVVGELLPDTCPLASNGFRSSECLRYYKHFNYNGDKHIVERPAVSFVAARRYLYTYRRHTGRGVSNYRMQPTYTLVKIYAYVMRLSKLSPTPPQSWQTLAVHTIVLVTARRYLYTYRRHRGRGVSNYRMQPTYTLVKIYAYVMPSRNSPLHLRRVGKL